MTVAEFIIRFLARRGVTHVFELAGGMITPLLDANARLDALKLVSMHHEQGAGFAAEGWARMTGIPGVAFATSGPGATNLLTAIGSCYFDSTPTVFVTGQVPLAELKGSRPIRQLGFQELDSVKMARPITKWAKRIQTGDELYFNGVLDHAFNVAAEGRPGPVLLDIPLDVLNSEVPDWMPPRCVGLDTAPVQAADIAYTLDVMHHAERPLVLIGGGVRVGLAADACRLLLEHLAVPVVTSLMGLDVLGSAHGRRVGMIGSYGNRWANAALGECDALLVLGSRLDIRQTGTDVEGFAKRKIIHVDIDPGEMNNRVKGVHAVHADLGDFCSALAAATKTSFSRPSWVRHIEKMRAKWPAETELKEVSGLNPNAFMRALGEASGLAGAFCIDVGQHQMWAAQSLVYGYGQRILTSGGMGAMGFALPAAIGAAFAQKLPVVVIAGDGGFQINVQELQTIQRNKLPIKMVVINNKALGMVRQFQSSYCGGRLQSTVAGYSAPDFTHIASAYGIRSRRVEREPVEDALTWLWSEPMEPMLLEVTIDMRTDVAPKLVYGRGLTDMEPKVP